MSDKKIVDSMKSKLDNLYSGAKEVEIQVKGSSGNTVQFSKLTDALRSQNGLTQEQAGILLHGSVEAYKRNDRGGSRTRGQIRNAWRSIKPTTEVAVAHTGSKEDQVYFIVSVENYKHWYNQFCIKQLLGEKLDTSKKSANDPETLEKLTRS